MFVLDRIILWNAFSQSAVFLLLFPLLLDLENKTIYIYYIEEAPTTISIKTIRFSATRHGSTCFACWGFYLPTLSKSQCLLEPLAISVLQGVSQQSTDLTKMHDSQQYINQTNLLGHYHCLVLQF